jgi:hypothetical protein
MATQRIAVERTIAASPSAIYGILRDYRNHHPKILPPAFREFRVESGGLGAGTIFTTELKTGGRTRRFRMQVHEPQPGHRLEERDLASSLVTTFYVQPAAAAGNSIVRIETTWEGAQGIKGLFERLFAPRVMRSLYTEELERLATYASTGPTSPFNPGAARS